MRWSPAWQTGYQANLKITREEIRRQAEVYASPCLLYCGMSEEIVHSVHAILQGLFTEIIFKRLSSLSELITLTMSNVRFDRYSLYVCIVGNFWDRLCW